MVKEIIRIVMFKMNEMNFWKRRSFLKERLVYNGENEVIFMRNRFVLLESVKKILKLSRIVWMSREYVIVVKLDELGVCIEM